MILGHSNPHPTQEKDICSPPSAVHKIDAASAIEIPGIKILIFWLYL